MPGKIKTMIDEIIAKQSKGQSAVVYAIRAKLILKGINPNKYTAESDDDPVMIEKLQKLADELNVAG